MKQNKNRKELFDIAPIAGGIQPQKYVAEGQSRLDSFLAEKFSEITRSQLKLQIEKGRVLVNGKPIVKSGYALKAGDEVETYFLFEEPLKNLEPENIPLDIIYEDDDIAVINKPRGMTVHPAIGSPKHTLANAILFHFDHTSDLNGNIRPGIVHRIDKDTTGLLVIAKNNTAHTSLAAQIAKHSAKRTYVALVEGNWKQDSGSICTNIGRDKKDRKKMAVVENGKLAVTNYKVLERFSEFTLMEFVLETGRTHQIRVHTAHMGHPVVGDPVYGFKKQKFDLDGQLLHAKKLNLTHPTTNQPMQFEAPLPDDFLSVLLKLRKKQSGSGEE